MAALKVVASCYPTYGASGHVIRTFACGCLVAWSVHMWQFVHICACHAMSLSFEWFTHTHTLHLCGVLLSDDWCWLCHASL